MSGKQQKDYDGVVRKNGDMFFNVELLREESDGMWDQLYAIDAGFADHPYKEFNFPRIYQGAPR